MWKSNIKTITLKKFRENNSWITSLVKTLIWRENVDFQLNWWSCFTVWKNDKFTLSHLKEISSNQRFSNFISKTVIFVFCQIGVKVNFLRNSTLCVFLTTFPHCARVHKCPKFPQYTAVLTVKFKKFLYHNFENNFRENNFLRSKSFTMKLISRNDSQVIQNFCKLHCAHSTLWILRNFCITSFWKISVKTTFSVKSLLYNWFHEINFKWYNNFINSTLCTVCKNEKFSLTEKKIRQINYLVISFVKPLLSRDFCKKVWERISAIFTLCCSSVANMYENSLSHFWQKFRESNDFTDFTKQKISQNII